MKSILLFLLFPAFVMAQQYPWAIGEGGVGSDIGKNIRFDKAGNVLLCGDIAGDAKFRGMLRKGHGLSDGFVAKYNTNGSLQWVQLLGGIKVDKASDCAADNNNAVFVTGYFEDSMSVGNKGAKSKGLSDIYVAKIDAGGNPVWLKTFGGAKTDQAYSIITDNSGNVYLCGTYTTAIQLGSFTLNSTNGFPESFIVKLDNNGSVIWAKSSKAAYTNTANSLCLLNNGDIAVTGYFSLSYTFDTTTVNASSTNYQVFIARLDENGNLRWLKSAGGGYDDVANSICTDGTNVFICGYSSGSANFGAFNISNSGYNDPFVAKFNEQGICQWANRGEGTKLDIGNGICCDQYGNVYATGFYEYNITFSGRSISGPDRNIFMVSYDNNGNIRWLQNAGESGTDCGLGINVDAQGNVYNTGYYLYRCIFGTTLLPLPEAEDIYLAKLDQATVGISNENTIEFSIYPNPTQGQLTFQGDLPYGLSYSVYNSLGELVTSSTLHNKTISTKDWTDGLYIISLMKEETIVGKKTFVIQR
jgi:hypothetical protein